MTSFGRDFLDAYVAESEEHLSSVRQALLTLEGSVGKPRPDKRTLDELFRSFHSLKGLAGMIEDREAELLAHEMESYLRSLRDAELRLTTAGIEALIDCTADLQRTIDGRARGQHPPDVRDSLRALVSASGDDAGIATGSEPAAGPEPNWECVFTPSPELLARGVNVDAVRERLRALGEILSASPEITDHAVSFRFLIATTHPPDPAATWAADGVSFRPVAPAPPAPSAVEAVPEASGVAPGQYVRVDLAKLDDLMRVIGDVVISRARLADALGRVEPHVPPAEWRAVQENAQTIERQLRELREGVMRVRLVPIGEIFRRMPFVVRDLAREHGRHIAVEVSGQHTEVDKFIVERMMDPVLHLVRNAVSHGLEPADERLAAGKPPDGRLELRAAAAGDLVTLQVADDGRGVDPQRVIDRARTLGLPLPAAVDDAALLDLICAPGFSTREHSDRVSGRGVGMDVVRTTIEDLGGAIAMRTRIGEGTSFTISLPLTLAITDALIVSVGAATFAVPQGAVREVIELESAAIRGLEGGEVALSRGQVLPVVRLAAVLHLDPPPAARHHALVVGAGAGAVAVLVDRIIGQREIVIRPTSDPLLQVNGVAGATDLGDGRAVLILDVPVMVRDTRLKESA